MPASLRASPAACAASRSPVTRSSTSPERLSDSMARRGTLPLAPLLALALLGCSVPIASGLDETDANRVVVALEGSGIAADKEIDPTNEGRFRVSVARDDAAGAATVLGQENLPPARA